MIAAAIPCDPFSSDDIRPTFHLYPQPEGIENIESADIRVFGNALHEMKKYIEEKGSQGIAAAIILDGECTHDGISFGDQMIVPVEIIHAQVSTCIYVKEYHHF